MDSHVNSLLSNITVYLKYARYDKDRGRRETWEEIIDRNVAMHKEHYAGVIKTDPSFSDKIDKAYALVYDKKVLPSMRSLQFAGTPIIRHPNRIYNCAYTPIDHVDVFGEIAFLLLGGTGVGYSVQSHHVEKLPTVQGPNANRKRRFLIGDSIEGWSDAITHLMRAYFYRKSTPIFDYSDIRPQGSPLVTAGGVAPGPQPLKTAIQQITAVLDKRKGQDEQLSSVEVHDIICHVAGAVLAGGIRRSALISLFSFDDERMITSKYGKWWELNPQRAMANNSAVIMRHRIRKGEFERFMERVVASNAGEPGVIFSNDAEYGTNPCGEISLRANQFCNLTEVNASDIANDEDFLDRSRAAAFIGTLQAGYTNFHYLRDCWKTTTEKEALIGVGLTGIASNKLTPELLEAGAEEVKTANKDTAKAIGINKAARTTTVKPAGTSSLVLGCSSGCHAWHDKYYIRTLRISKSEAIYDFLKARVPSILEDDYFKPTTDACIRIPIVAPSKGTIRTEETVEQFVERVKELNEKWVREGHRSGHNTNNVSATVSVRDEDWKFLIGWMWKNRKGYNGLSCLPFDGGTYKQTPFESCTEYEYRKRVKAIRDDLEANSVALDQLFENADNTDLKGEAACAGGACEIV